MGRLLLAFPLAILSALGLFTFMAWMVNPVDTDKREHNSPLSFNMVMLEQEEHIQRRQRTVPEQPDLPEPPPEAAPAAQAQAAVNLNSVPATPSLNLSTAVTGIDIAMPNFGDVGVIANNQQVMPLYRVEPRYPTRAQRQGLEGQVTLSFTIDEQGRPTDIEVVEAEPKRIFEREAMQALRRWKYQPQIIDGVAVQQPGRMVTIEFKLPK